MDRILNIILVSASVIIALAGLFFVFKIWTVWKRVDREVLKARVFLNHDFLEKNWIYLFLAGAFIAMRRVMQLLELLGFSVNSDWVTYLYDLMGIIVIVLLVMLAYHWYRLVYSTLPQSQSYSAKAPASMEKL
ncbi:MAG TPA: hypothetical protein VIO58_07795 [Candidatus Methanoperedens sp.]